MVRVSVVIPAYNEAKYLSACLNAFTGQDADFPFEIIVVDNNSTDRTVDIAAEFSGILPITIITELNKGRGAARKKGFELARGDIILSTDADTVVPGDWIRIMAAHFESPDTLAVTGRMRIADFHPAKNALLYGYHLCMTQAKKILSGQYWLHGYNFGIRRDTYLKSGAFNGQLNIHEDTELTFRVSGFARVRLAKNSCVLTSGRRFKGTMIPGITAYRTSFIRYYLFRKSPYLSDIR